MNLNILYITDLAIPALTLSHYVVCHVAKGKYKIYMYLLMC